MNKYPLLLKSLTVIALLVLCTQSSQALDWYLLKTNFKTYKEASAFIKSRDNQEVIFSLLYEPKYIVFAGDPSIFSGDSAILQIYSTAKEVENSNIPEALKMFFIHRLSANRVLDLEPEKDAVSHIGCSAARKVQTKNSTSFTQHYNRWNSEQLKGIIACNTLFIESDGTEDPNYFSWTNEGLMIEKETIMMALHVWAVTAQRAGVDATFVPLWFDRMPELGQGIEPNIRFGAWEMFNGQVTSMAIEVLKKLGYDLGYFSADEFNYAQKLTTGADYAFTMPVHFNHNNKGYIRAHANLGGPMTFLNSGTHFSVYGHEIAHIFHAFDEYLNNTCEVSPWFIFNGVQNLNNIGGNCPQIRQPCLMINNRTEMVEGEIQYALCDYTKAHLGWKEGIPSYPTINFPTQDTFINFPFQTFEFYFPGPMDQLRSGIVKIWKLENELEELYWEESFELGANVISWVNNRLFESGNYKLQIYHGEFGQYAIVPGETLRFEIEDPPILPFRDTCIFFCQNPDTLKFGAEDWIWYEASNLEEIIHVGPDFYTETGGTFVVLKHKDEKVLDGARIEIGVSPYVSAQLIQEVGGPNLYLSSFIGFPNVHKFNWYRNDTLVYSGPSIFYQVDLPGVYQVEMDNGCLSYTNELIVYEPPEIEVFPICEDGAYLLKANQPLTFENLETNEVIQTDSLVIQVQDEEYIGIQVYTLDQSTLIAVYELEPLNGGVLPLENYNGYLQVKTNWPGSIEWYRNDTLIQNDRRFWLTVDQPGNYHALIPNSIYSCPQKTASFLFESFVPPPKVPNDTLNQCLRRENSNVEVIMEGENLKWYLEPSLEEQIARGNVVELDLSYWIQQNRIFITQTIEGEESGPAVLVLSGQTPLETSLDTIGNQLLGIVNGIDWNTAPRDYQFDWFLDKNYLGTTEIPFWKIETPGTYHLELSIPDHGCIMASPMTIEGVVSDVNDPILRDSDIEVYPNPAMESFFVESQHLKIQQIYLYTMQGKMVGQYLFNGVQKAEIRLADLPAGIYVGVVRVEKGLVQTFRMVKE